MSEAFAGVTSFNYTESYKVGAKTLLELTKET
jgi:hypothetical protein